MPMSRQHSVCGHTKGTTPLKKRSPQATGNVTERALRTIPCLCLFLAYPLALICPARLGQVISAVQARAPILAPFLPRDFDFPVTFHVALPVALWLSCFATAYLAVTPIRAFGGRHGGSRQNTIQFSVLLAASLTAVSAWLGRTQSLADILILLGFFTIPVFYAVCPRQLVPRRLALCLAVLWCVHVFHALWQWQVGFEVVGLAGNRNWMSTTIVALCPWCWVALSGTMRPQPNSRRTIQRLLVAILPLALSLWAVAAGRSRGTCLALAGYAVFFAITKCSSRQRQGVLAAILLAMGGMAGWLGRAQLTAAARDDVRLPLYSQTVRLIADYPLLGIGPGNFTREFVTYRSLTHKRRRLAAVVTAHPHNETLHLAAQLGIPLAVLWCLGLVCLGRLPKFPMFRAAHFSVWMIMAHAQFDKVLVQPPTGLIGLILLGLLWRRRARSRAWSTRRSPTLRRLAPGVALSVICYALGASVLSLQVGWSLRKAFLAEDVGNRFAEEGKLDYAAKLYHYAYTAFRRTAQLQPRDVRTHTFSGTIANRRLRNREVALSHLWRAHQIDPNFAHLNGEIGMALGALRRHHEAYPFFRREVELYPFDVMPSQRLVICGLMTGHEAEIVEANSRLGQLRDRELRHGHGEEWLVHTTQSVGAALAGSDWTKAAEMAGQLTAPFGKAALEPAFFALASDAELPPGALHQSFSSEDAEVWAFMNACGRLAEEAGGLPELIATLATTRSPSDQLPAPPLPLLPNTWPKEQAKPFFSHLVLTFAARQGNTGVVWVRTASGALTGAVEIVGPQQRFVANLNSGALLPNLSLAEVLPDNDLRDSVGVAPTDREAVLRVTLAAFPCQFSFRTQALGQLLARRGAAPTPRLGWSPSLALWHTRHRLQGVVSPSAPADAVKNCTSLATIGFDPLPFELAGPRLSNASR